MSRRRALLRLTPEALTQMLKGSNDGYRFKIVENGLPEDVTFFGVNYSPEHAAFVFCLGSEEFEPVSEGNMMPMIEYPVAETTSDPHEMETHVMGLLGDLSYSVAHISKNGLGATVREARDRIRLMLDFLSTHEK